MAVFSRSDFSRAHELPLSVLIAVSTRLYREGLVQALSSSEFIDVVGFTGDCGEVVERVTELLPQIVLVDTHMPSSYAVISAIMDRRPESKVVALSVSESPDEVTACAEAGVAGFVTQDGSIDDLIRVMRAASSGEFQCSARVAAALVKRLSAVSRSRPVERSLSSLTMRELEIIRLIDVGLSNKAIARMLSIKVPTVKNHVHNILEKLDARGRCEAAALYRQSVR